MCADEVSDEDEGQVLGGLKLCEGDSEEQVLEVWEEKMGCEGEGGGEGFVASKVVCVDFWRFASKVVRADLLRFASERD